LAMGVTQSKKSLASLAANARSGGEGGGTGPGHRGRENV